MDVHRSYCSAVDRNVPVRLRAGVPVGDHRTLHDPSDLICLDYRVRCTGWCCPLMSVDDRAAGEPAGAPSPADRHAVPASSQRARRWAPPT